METTIYLAFAAAACIMSLGIMPVIIHLAKKRGIFEENDDRKTHTEKVSSFGGIGIMVAFTVPILLLIYSGTNSPVAAFGLAIPLFAISLLDDVFGLRVALRFAVHAAIGLTLYQMGFTVIELKGLPLLNAGATVVFTILLINAYNLIDGINGLSGGLGVIGCFVFGTVLSIRGEHDMALACFSFAGALLGYLSYNFGKKALIFMGDNGSTVLGFLTAVMAMAILRGEEAGDSGTNLALVLAVISVPSVDLFKVAIMRAYRSKSPFSPDRSHIHHLFTDNLLSHPTACLLLFGWTLVMVGLAFVLPGAYAFKVLIVITVVPYLLARALRSTNNLIDSQRKGGNWKLESRNWKLD